MPSRQAGAHWKEPLRALSSILTNCRPLTLLKVMWALPMKDSLFRLTLRASLRLSEQQQTTATTLWQNILTEPAQPAFAAQPTDGATQRVMLKAGYGQANQIILLSSCKTQEMQQHLLWADSLAKPTKRRNSQAHSCSSTTQQALSRRLTSHSSMCLFLQLSATSLT